MKVSYTTDELNDWYIECQENAEILLYVGERPNGHFTMKQLVVALVLVVSIVFILYVYFSPIP